ncbi:MAG TPA: hypothetical protein VGG05_18500 [Pseudonocardiaceae bacterium]|jgi:hypothetical protein
MQAPFSSTTNWTYPTTDGQVRTIQQANVNLCMQLDATDGLIVREAPCNGDTAENWINRANPRTHRTEFESQWFLVNAGGKFDCLTWAVSTNRVLITPCDPTTDSADQQFGTS